MAIVATVVVVGVNLPRPPRVERGRRRWVGVMRRRVLCQGRTFLPGVFIGLGSCASTPTTQTTPAVATKNVSAPLFAHPVPTKIEPGSPRANHAQAICTALPVPPVAHILQQHAQRVQTPFRQLHVLPRVVLSMDPSTTMNRVNVEPPRAPIQPGCIAPKK